MLRCSSAISSCRPLLSAPSSSSQCLYAPSSLTPLAAQPVRSIIRIPKHENHIRYDPTVGRKVPTKDVLDRFKRLNNGMWLKSVPGRHKWRYMKNEPWLTNSLKAFTCSKRDCQILDAMMTPFWLRKRYPINDPYAFYQTRRNMPAYSPRVDEKGNFTHERPKILLDDLTADKYFAR